jgi:hypothetical protein
MQYCLLNPDHVSSLFFLEWHSANPVPDHELKKKKKKRSPAPLPLPAAGKKAPAKKPEKKAQAPPTKTNKKQGVEKAPTALQTATSLDVPTPKPTNKNSGLTSELTDVVEFTALIQRLSKATMAQKGNDQ